MSDTSYTKLRKSLNENRRKGAFPFPSYAQALFSQVFVSRTPVEGQFVSKKAPSSFPIPGVAPATKPGVPNEKNKVFSSLDKYVDEKIAARPDSAVKFSAEEITKKESISISCEDIKEEHPALWVDEYTIESLKTIFVGERPKDFNEDEPQADLLSKMVVAMKLKANSFTRVFLEKDKQVASLQWNQVLNKVSPLEDVVIVSLGAMATNLILGRKERLSRIHGQEFQLILEGGERETKLAIFPVFHPDILQINPNMKRSAWLDLQKVMKRL